MLNVKTRWRLRLLPAIAAAVLALSALGAAAAPRAHATHTVQWAGQQACAATAGFGQAVIGQYGPYGGCVLNRGSWNFPGHANRFWVQVYHSFSGGCLTSNPWAMAMWAEVTDAGAVTTNYNDWAWVYC